MEQRFLFAERLSWMKLVVVALSCLMLVGCGPEVLYSNLSESDANTMMGLLLARNIQAVKTAQKENLFSISVPRQQFAAATDLLKWYGIPTEKFSGIGEVFKKTGIVSSPSEEKIRFMYALSQQISETLSHIDGVLIARVSLVLPKNDPYTETLTPSSASVFLKFRPGAVPPTLVPQIKTLVMKSVEGLNYDNVSVVIVQSENIDYYYPINLPQDVSFFGIKIPKKIAPDFWLVILAVIVITVAVVIALIFGSRIIAEIVKNKTKEALEKATASSAVAAAPTVLPATESSVTLQPPVTAPEGALAPNREKL